MIKPINAIYGTAGQDLPAVPVTTISYRFEILHLQDGFVLLTHGGKLGVISAIIGHLMRHDEMVLCLHRHLRVVAHHVGLMAHSPNLWLL